jgi:hypothetical protein
VLAEGHRGNRTKESQSGEPQLTALAIVGRLSERYPEKFSKKQHSIERGC